MDELYEKQKRIRALLTERQLDAMLLRRVSSFAWATGGAASYVNTATTEGAAALLIKPGRRYLIANNIEATRLQAEEKLAAQGWDMSITPWYGIDFTIAMLIRGLKLGADSPYPGATDLSYELARLRAHLTPAEGERFRMLGRLCAEAMDHAIREVRPGQTEYEIAAILARETLARGAQPIVNLIATDERVFKFRHPLPTDKKLEKYAMLVLCGRKWGLVCSITRLVHFGRLPDDVRRKADACARIDATMIAATKPGQTLDDILKRAVATYAETGFANEWQLHHQGGPAGYEPREFLATPNAPDMVAVGQAYAWNPSITGAKSEDTILVGQTENEVLTTISDWPMLSITVDGRTMEQPAILEIT
jgi:Xaa-Pro aminopeptidase